MTGYSPNGTPGGKQRTDMHCHQCSKTFVALLDYDIEGNHTVECPVCGHHHFRVIQRGLITGERWHSGLPEVHVEARDVWKTNVLAVECSSAAQFIRNSWLRLSEGQ